MISPSGLLAQLVERKSRPERLRNLAILNKICEAQHAGTRDFRLPVIGRFFEAAGGLKARALNNKASEDYRALISAWRESSPPMAVISRQSEIVGNSIFARIDDLALRTLMQSVWAERNRLRNELNQLKSTTKLLVDRRPVSIGASGGVSSAVPTTLVLTATERAALEAAVSSAHLESQGWTEGENGEIRKGARLVFDLGYTRSIRKILKHTAPVGGSGAA